METSYPMAAPFPAPEAVKAAPEKKEGRIAQLILSLVIFAGFVVLLFVPDSAFGSLQPMSDSALGGSLMLGEIVGLFKHFTLNFEAMPVYAAALLFFLAAYAVLLLCTIVSLFKRNRAAAKLNILKTAFMLLATVFYILSLLYEGVLSYDDIFTDPKTFIAINSTVISLAFGFIMLLVLLFTAHKSFGLVKLVYVLLAAVFLAVASQTFVGVYDFTGMLKGADLEIYVSASKTLQTITSIVFQAFACALLLNFILALFSAISKRTEGLDLARSCVLLVLAAGAFVLLGVCTKFANGFFDYLGTIVATAAALVQFLFSLVVLIILRSQKKREAREAAQTEQPVQPSPFIVGADNQMAMRGLEQPAYAPQPQAQAEQPAPVFEEAARANDALEEAAQLTFDDIPASEPDPEPEPEPAAAYENVIRDEPAPEKEEKEEKPYDFDQARYDGTFNRAYAEFSEKPQQTEQAYEPYRPAQTYQAPRTYTQPAPAQNTAPFAEAQASYVPDAFINGLTAAERDEFNKLFISRIYGENKRLPAYIIGGDNREFFTKVFVFMGRYRNVISDGLLEKIYEYSNLIR